MVKEKIPETVNIDSSFCWRCGKPFSKGSMRKTKHHSIPISLGYVRNVTVPVHDKCHKEINAMYANQQKKPRAPKDLTITINKIEGIIGTNKRALTRAEKLYHSLIKQRKEIEK